MTGNLQESKREQTNSRKLHACWESKPKLARSLLIPLVVLLSILFAECGSCGSVTVAAQQTRLEFERSIQVTPDDEFLTGSFARINYVPGTNCFVVTFGIKASTEPNTSLGAGYAFKEYDLDLQATGKSGIIQWYPNVTGAGDSGSCMVNNTSW